MSKVKSLQELSQEKVIDQLKPAIDEYAATTNFVCHGSIPIDPRATTRSGDFTSTSTPTPVTSPPVTLRWHCNHAYVPMKANFPLVAGGEQILQHLMSDCRAAPTFQYPARNMDDPSVAKAGRLEGLEISTSVDPCKSGILATVAQVLLPGMARPKMDGDNTIPRQWGVVVKLRSLNVYSASSGQIKAHIYTSHAFNHFGSLVVSLPSPCSGGNLRVAHRGVEHLMDLGSESHDPSIRWAAFYSDCESLALPVTSGHRITLFYQLYLCKHVGDPISQHFPDVHLTLDPLYDSVKSMLSTAGFMGKGGILGFYCTHQYSFKDCNTNMKLPRALKGIDFVIFSIFRSLGLKVHIRPIRYNGYAEMAEGHGSSELEEEDREGEEERGEERNELDGREEESDEETSDEGEYYEEETRACEGEQCPCNRNLPPQKLVFTTYEDEDFRRIEDLAMRGRPMNSPCDIFRAVKWLNEPVGEDLNEAFTRHVLDNCLDNVWWFSLAAILVEVPGWQERDLAVVGEEEV